MSEMICGKNMSQFHWQMDLYGSEHGLNDDQLFQMMGVTISDTNFNRQHGFYPAPNYAKTRNRNESWGECWNWRFSRDGLFAACPLSPEKERISYEGWPTTNLLLSVGMPFLWEKGAYHDGQRHVICYKEFFPKLVTDAQFHALTNQFVKNVVKPKS